MKKCNICGCVKSLDSFNMEKRNNTYRNYCKECGKIASRDRSRTVDGIISRMYTSQKNASKRRGYEQPNYTKNELGEWLKIQKNFKTLYHNWKESNYHTDLSLSCDRIDDYSPYTLDNIQLMTWKENNDKGNLDIKEGRNTKQCKRVIQYDLSMNIIAEYHSANEASRQTGISRPHICTVCRGEAKTIGGYKWEYSDS